MSSDQRPCYNPDGDVPWDHVPCTSDEISPCCNVNSLCMNNGFCLSLRQPYVVYRATCTADPWAQGCPQYCSNPGDPFYLHLAEYDRVEREYKFCCTDDPEAVSGCNGSTTFPLPDTGVLYRGEFVTSAAAFDAPDSVPSQSSVSQPQPSQTNASNPTVSQSNTILVEPSNSPQCNESSPNGSPSRDVAIGVGVGVPLGALMLACLAWALVERRAKLASRKLSVPMSHTGTRLEATRRAP